MRRYKCHGCGQRGRRDRCPGSPALRRGDQTRAAVRTLRHRRRAEVRHPPGGPDLIGPRQSKRGQDRRRITHRPRGRLRGNQVAVEIWGLAVFRLHRGEGPRRANAGPPPVRGGEREPRAPVTTRTAAILYGGYAGRRLDNTHLRYYLAAHEPFELSRDLRAHERFSGTCGKLTEIKAGLEKSNVDPDDCDHPCQATTKCRSTVEGLSKACAR